MDLRVSSDFSDVEDFFSRGEDMVESAMVTAGRNAVEYAKANGNYTDHTGNLRASGKAEVKGTVLTLYNDAKSPKGFPYAAVVESKGYDVLGKAALNAEKELKEKFE